MFKKITHNIVEEHFSSTISNSNLVLPKLVINENTMNFRMDSRTLWTRYAFGMINFSVALFGDMVMSYQQVEQNMIKVSDEIGEYFVPYYGLTAGNKIKQLLIDYANIGMDICRAIKIEQSYSNLSAQWPSAISAIAEYLNQLNPEQYPRDLLFDQFNNLQMLWVNNFEARKNNDSLTTDLTQDGIKKVAVTGIPDHNLNGYSSIADTLSRGIIAQYPSSFVS